MKKANRNDKPRSMRRIISVLATLLVVIPILNNTIAAASDDTPLPKHVIDQFGTPPDVPDGNLSEELLSAINLVFVDTLTSKVWTPEHSTALETIASSGDARLVWLISDLMRFAGQGGLSDRLATTAAELLKIKFTARPYWNETTDHLIAWDIPAPPDYLKFKRGIFNTIVPGWEYLFTEGEIDWRHVSWGGVLIDNRAYDTTDEPCNCIPAADNPDVTNVEAADWLDDDAIVFGIEVNGEYRAYPRRIMEVREMVNDTLGGRDLGIPYCTLCGSAQAYFTDELPDGVERPVLRTSGLLIRSNKVMYDVVTNSVFDTFRGMAVTGELARKKVRLSQASVVTTDWGTWRKAHPTTTVLAEALALGRDFDFRNNRDADGPIFPIGDVDPRLDVHEDIVGVVTASGQRIAFQRSEALVELTKGKVVEFENVRLQLNGGGIQAVDKNGDDLGSHQAFWFAWSQFYPDTLLWPN